VLAESFRTGRAGEHQRPGPDSADRSGGEQYGKRQHEGRKAEHHGAHAGSGIAPVTTRILIADDHAFVSWGVAKALAVLEDVEIIGSVTNGIQAIAEIRKHRPDCAILDYNMPGANGLEVFLESKRWSPATRFVVLTGTATAQAVNRLAEAGVHGICLKDGTEGEIVDIVRQVVAGRTAISAGAKLLMKAPDESVDVTDRELAVLQAIARGHTNASAAESLGISPKTVDTHRTSLMRKFSVNSTASLLLAAVRAGLLDPTSIR
jgi:DNA-binding NarL/FixJ family response regulator